MMPLQPDRERIVEVVSRGPTLDDQNPWPGPEAYNEASSRFFYGRSQESRELMRLVRSAPLTVVYGKSGLGKTSLLQAGLYPLLRGEHYLPIHLRIHFYDGSGVSPLDQAMGRLTEELKNSSAEYPEPRAGESLWEYLHRNDLEIWSKDNYPLVPVLVFDQFEEVFSRSGGNSSLIMRLFDDLADLIENRIPAGSAGPEAEAMSSRLDLRSQRYRIVLSFREDFLPDLRALEKKAPSLLRNFLRLEPMSRQCAVDAVKDAGKAVLDPGVAPCIVDFVSKRDHSVEAPDMSDMAVEPVLLSLCCYQLNRRRRPEALIDKALVDEAGEDILDSFYRDALNDPDVKGPPDAALFIEGYLIQGDHFRGDYPKDGALNEGKLTSAQLAALTNTHHLLRTVQHPDTTRVELIHDRLVPVVRKARDDRRIKQHQEDQERLAREAEAERDKERARSDELEQQRDKARFSRNVASVVAIVCLVLIAWAIIEWQIARDERRQKERLKQSMYLSLSAQRLARGEVAYKAGSEPIEQKLFIGLAAFRLAADKDFPQARVPSLTALHSVMETYGHLRKAVTVDGLVPTPAMAYSPDGKALAVGGEDGVVRLLDAETFKETGMPLKCPQSSSESVWTLAYNSDGTRLAAGYASINEKVPGSGLVCVFDVRQGDILRSWSAKELWDTPGNINSVAFGGRPGTEFVISGGSDKTLRKLDVNSGNMSQLPHQAEVAAVAISADGSKVASGGDDAVIRIWNVADFSRPNARPVELRGHWATIQQAVFSPSAPSLLVSAGDDGRVMAWNVDKGCLSQESASQPARIYNLAVSRDGLVATAGADGNVSLFRLSEVRKCDGPSLEVIPDGVLSGHGGLVMGLAYNRAGDRLASSGQDGSIRIWGPKTEGISMAELTMKSRAGNVTSLAISPDGKYIAAGDDKGNVHLWDRPEENEYSMNPAAATWNAHGDAIRGLAFIRNRNQIVLVSGCDDGTIKRWDPSTKQAVGQDMTDDAGRIRSIAVSPDGNLLAAGSIDGVVRLWEAETGALSRRIDRPRDAPEGYELNAAGFTNDGKYLAVGSSLSYLRVLEVARPDFEVSLPGHIYDVMSLSRGKAWLLSAGSDGVLEWEQSALDHSTSWSLKKQDIFKYHIRPRRAKPLLSMAASNDGKLIVFSGKEGTVQLWDGDEHVQIGGRFLNREEKSDISGVAMAPDGSYFVTVDSNSRVLVFPGPDRWADIICSKLTHNMSHEQWSKLVSEEIPYVCQCPGLPIASDDQICPPAATASASSAK